MARNGDGIIRTAVDYIAGILPSALVGIEGCPDADIVAFEASRGLHISDIHRAFLRIFGYGVGGMDFGPADPTLDALRDIFESTTGSLPDDIELFAVSRQDPYRDVFLVHSGAEEPVVGTAYSQAGSDFGNITEESIAPVAGTLSELLCYMPFVKAKALLKPLQINLFHQQFERDAIAKFDRVIREHRLTTLWFSSSVSRFVEFSKTVIIAKQIPAAPLAVFIGSSDEEEFANAQHWITEGVGVNRGG